MFEYNGELPPPEPDKSAPPLNGGKFVMDRKTVAVLVEMSAFAVKLYIWILSRANFKDRDRLKRGQCVATIAEMRDALTYYAGFRKISPTQEQCRSAYEALRQATMITTAKTTRGMIITVCNYDEMQKIKKREAHNETDNDNAVKPGGTPHDTEQMVNECNKCGEVATTPALALDEKQTLFVRYWKRIVETLQDGLSYRVTKQDNSAIQELFGLEPNMHNICSDAANFLLSDKDFHKSRRTIDGLLFCWNDKFRTHSIDKLRSRGLFPPDGTKLSDWLNTPIGPPAPKKIDPVTEARRRLMAAQEAQLAKEAAEFEAQRAAA
jgi:hypothetical protein